MAVPRSLRYFSADETDEKVVLRLEPSPFTTEIIARATPEAMRPYSIAVAADLSFRKAFSVLIMSHNGCWAKSKREPDYQE